ncbi:MAG: CidA/LrgA family protein [Chitinophagales bacterium]|nr:CidA/LrgA family protein [Hyphomicrobiales bacterium]
MLKSIAQILAFLLAGEVIAIALGGLSPGPLCGMIMMFCWLQAAEPSPELEAAAGFLTGNLGLLFIPAGVAVVNFGDLLAQNGIALFICIVVSTAAAIALTGLIANAPPFGAYLAKLRRMTIIIMRRWA